MPSGAGCAMSSQGVNTDPIGCWSSAPARSTPGRPPWCHSGQPPQAATCQRNYAPEPSSSRRAARQSGAPSHPRFPPSATPRRRPDPAAVSASPGRRPSYRKSANPAAPESGQPRSARSVGGSTPRRRSRQQGLQRAHNILRVVTQQNLHPPGNSPAGSQIKIQIAIENEEIINDIWVVGNKRTPISNSVWASAHRYHPASLSAVDSSLNLDPFYSVRHGRPGVGLYHDPAVSAARGHTQGFNDFVPGHRLGNSSSQPRIRPAPLAGEVR